MTEIKKELKVMTERIDTPAFHRNYQYIVEVLISELKFNCGNIKFLEIDLILLNEKILIDFFKQKINE